MRRFAPHIIVVLVVLAVLAVRWRAEGQLPATCSFPDQLDQFPAVSVGQKWTAALHNELLCAINELEAYVLALQVGGEAQCTAVSLTAGQRKLITVSLGEAVTGTEPLFLSARESANGWLEPSGIVSASGSAVTAYVFNRDPDNTRTGTVCVQVVRS